MRIQWCVYTSVCLWSVLNESIDIANTMKEVQGNIISLMTSFYMVNYRLMGKQEQWMKAATSFIELACTSRRLHRSKRYRIVNNSVTISCCIWNWMLHLVPWSINQSQILCFIIKKPKWWLKQRCNKTFNIFLTRFLAIKYQKSSQYRKDSITHQQNGKKKWFPQIK